MKAFITILVPILFLIITNVHLKAAEFVLLGDLAAVDAISDDGTVVAGGERRRTVSGSQKAWRWTRDGEFSFLTPRSGDTQVWIRGMSGDATVIAGKSGSFATAWTADDAPIWLGGLRGDSSSWGWDMSANGNVIVGVSRVGPGTQGIATAVRWSLANDKVRIEPLDPLPDFEDSHALGVSADGSVVVGQSRMSTPRPPFGFEYESEATLWVEQNGEMQTVGLGTAGGQDSLASLVSRDGFTVVGAINGTGVGGIRSYLGKHEAFRFRWSDEDAKMEPLGFLEGMGTTPTGISYDASVIVGNSDDPRKGFVWDEVHEMRDLHTVLAQNHGIDVLSGWHRINVNTMSADTRSLGGRLWESENSDYQAWALFLDRPLIWISGDVDHDFDVDFEDFLTLAANFGKPGEWHDGDFDLNGTVEFADFLALSENFGTEPNVEPTAVPEPSAMTLFGIALLALLRASRRRTEGCTQ